MRAVKELSEQHTGKAVTLGVSSDEETASFFQSNIFDADAESDQLPPEIDQI